ncbi:MAG: hypothetical protein ACYCXG_11830 [Acidiferrobacter sp.]
MTPAAEVALSHCRKILEAPSRAAVWWDTLPRTARALLLRAADVPGSEVGHAWEAMPATMRVAVIEAARRASTWARDIGAPIL